MNSALQTFLSFTLTAFVLVGCSTVRALVEFESLESNLDAPELNSEQISKIAPRPKLPPIWRGRKLFTSPWAYIYAKDKKSAEYVYDELEDISTSEDKQSTYGLVIVTGAEDTETAFEYKKIKALYEDYITNENLDKEEKEFFQKDLKNLNKIEKFHTKVNSKANEKKGENDLASFRQSIDRIITCATFFIQPEIMEPYMNTPIDQSVYWCAFISVDDTIDENLNGIVSSLLKDYDVSAIGKGLIWGIITPGFYFKKRDVIKQTQRTFEEGYEKNALMKKTNIEFSDRAIESHTAAEEKGSK